MGGPLDIGKGNYIKSDFKKSNTNESKENKLNSIKEEKRHEKNLVAVINNFNENQNKMTNILEEIGKHMFKQKETSHSDDDESNQQKSFQLKVINMEKEMVEVKLTIEVLKKENKAKDVEIKNLLRKLK